MKEIKFNLINKICEEQDFDELLLKILSGNSKNRINNILQDIEKNSKLNLEMKKQLYEEIFEYVNDINEYYKKNIKMIFSIGVIKTIRKINEIYDKELLKGNGNMNSKIKIIIADDDKGACDLLEKFLRDYDDIEILGIANTDKEEINMIENLKPEIVITDLMRNHKYTGLDIIRDYFIKNKSLQFLVISADDKKEVINNGLEVAGYIKKPFIDYEQIYIELKRIKRELEEREYIEWDEKYHNEEIVQVKKLLNWKDKKILKRLGISVKNKKYTECELECLTLDLLKYYDDPEEKLSEEEKEYHKSLEGTNVSRNDYNELLNKIEKIRENVRT